MSVLDEHVAVDCVADFRREVEERGVRNTLEQKFLLSFVLGAVVTVHVAVWSRYVLVARSLASRVERNSLMYLWRSYVCVIRRCEGFGVRGCHETVCRRGRVVYEVIPLVASDSLRLNTRHFNRPALFVVGL